MSESVKNVDDDTALEEQARLQEEELALHGWDFIFSVVVIVFSIFIIAHSLTMPFSGTVGGVKTTWYESPGLLPLFIGAALLLAGIVLFVNNAKENGRTLFMERIKDVNPSGFLISGGGILTYIYIMITWYDFFLASLVFLLFYIGLYYLDEPKISSKLIKLYSAFMVLSVAIFGSGLDETINAGYEFTTDIILIVAAIAIFALFKISEKQYGAEFKRKVKVLALVSFLFPLVICPIFRYFLLVPLPKEGIVVEQVLNTTYFKYAGQKEVKEGKTLSADEAAELDDAF
ncbi:tripartite tricarboxylate transporter TctB family protein [Vibrio algarum]|uniref:DUF1468 domain-containing protein n=1 Tax=Vibrio algarum TaxID=3020714 RepID=A0ABT4YTM3_9VIBR|nr:tripartite tricarboxylate transporter TctB family protein [Vibrio sp. KJ40-1]MDB1124917.1 hypothetical protein [Vibrio sp. KJ40-1]